ncbi:Uncharacterised protein [Delftia tsuruhatensis]|nr:Uncharacterised protein [Delftia tsuruhatensis]CAC9691251.1 Uncharacterised protein [Delftia tsuruhatensis]
MRIRRIAAWVGWIGGMALAGGLAGCAVPGQGGDKGPAPAQAPVAAPSVPPVAAAPTSAWSQALLAKGCALPVEPVGDRLEHLQRELEPLGLEPRLQACVSLAQSQPAVALLLDAWVTDGRKAVAVVRGPLADGEALDLGLRPARADAAAATDDEVSPDVQFNRRWWQGRLRAYGLQAVPGRGGAFVPTP